MVLPPGGTTPTTSLWESDVVPVDGVSQGWPSTPSATLTEKNYMHI
jgi:hypothetical protein